MLPKLIILLFGAAANFNVDAEYPEWTRLNLDFPDGWSILSLDYDMELQLLVAVGISPIAESEEPSLLVLVVNASSGTVHTAGNVALNKKSPGPSLSCGTSCLASKTVCDATRCSACADDQYRLAECTEFSDTVCSTCSECTLGYELSAPCTAHADTVCSKLGWLEVYEKAAGNDGVLTIDDLQRYMLDMGLDLYLSSVLGRVIIVDGFITLQAFSILEDDWWVVDNEYALRHCTCNSTHYGIAHCTEKAAVVCAPCLLCGQQQFTSLNCSRVDTVCNNCTICPAGTVTAVACSRFHDTVCEKCLECPSGKYLSSPCQDGLNGAVRHDENLCSSCTVCGSGEYYFMPCTLDADSECDEAVTTIVEIEVTFAVASSVLAEEEDSLVAVVGDFLFGTFMAHVVSNYSAWTMAELFSYYSHTVKVVALVESSNSRRGRALRAVSTNAQIQVTTQGGKEAALVTDAATAPGALSDLSSKCQAAGLSAANGLGVLSVVSPTLAGNTSSITGSASAPPPGPRASVVAAAVGGAVGGLVVVAMLGGIVVHMLLQRAKKKADAKHETAENDGFLSKIKFFSFSTVVFEQKSKPVASTANSTSTAVGPSSALPSASAELACAVVTTTAPLLGAASDVADNPPATENPAVSRTGTALPLSTSATPRLPAAITVPDTVQNVPAPVTESSINSRLVKLEARISRLWESAHGPIESTTSLMSDTFLTSNSGPAPNRLLSSKAGAAPQPAQQVAPPLMQVPQELAQEQPIGPQFVNLFTGLWAPQPPEQLDKNASESKV